MVHFAHIALSLCLALCGVEGRGLYEADYYNSLFLPSYLQNFKAKVEILGAVLKRHVQELRAVENRKVDLVFIVDSSTSVGSVNFYDELKFVRKMLADFTVDVDTTRVSVITFSSRERVRRQVDHMTSPSPAHHKCALLEDEIPRIAYVGGGTYTLGAILEAKQVLKAARPDAAKVIFLITDGFSNGGDPLPEAAALQAQGVKIFTFGIRNGNVRELFAMASDPKNETCYILESFEEFEALARRALHEDLHAGTYIAQPEIRCQRLCRSPGRCCHGDAECSCGTHTGKYECLCRPGYYGHGVGSFGCQPCPVGTYKNHSGPGDVSVCTKCPDENHVTPTNASTDVSQCQCKKGYRTSNSSSCSVFRCPELQPPDNGYFVNDQCNNVFNAACGLRCQPGYELHGSGLRICQEDGNWSGTDTECIMKMCPPLLAPKNGQMICSRDDFTYSTVCRFTCDIGYKLVGSRKRTCLAIAFWTGIATRCREITCPPLASPRDGSVQPTVCTEGDVSFGTTCRTSCLPGYTLYGTRIKQCLPEGSWAPATPTTQCKDESAPQFQCPDDVEVEADEEEGEVEVTWNIPLAVDNSGFVPALTVEPPIMPPAHFPIGVTTINYTAEDFSKNKAMCSFTVTVIDRIPPRVDRCFSPDPVISPDQYGNVTWEEPLFTDNSGVTVRVERSHEPGWFSRGHTEVTYTAFDESGNNITCTLDIRVLPHPCEFPAPPKHGNRTCYEDAAGVHCRLSCQEGFAFVVPPAPEYLCAYDNVWKPQDSMPFPDCAEQKISNDVKQPASLTYSGSITCEEGIELKKIQNDFKAKITERVSDLCRDNVICGVDDVGTTCEEGKDFNKIQIVLDRRRRRRRRSVDGQRFKRASSANGKVIFSFKVKGSMNRTGDVTEDRRRQRGMTKNVQHILRTLKRDAKEGIFDPVASGSKMHFRDMTFDPESQTFVCPEGSILLNNACVNCPVGMFFNVVEETCQGCPVGSYQTLEGAVTCLECPGNSSTLNNRSSSLKECKARCLPGSFSANGLEPCETCTVGDFQPEYAQNECLPCPKGRQTLRRGTRRKSSCKAVCQAGYASKTGLAPCLPCPQGSYQHQSGQVACLQCPYGGHTRGRASTSLADCEGSWEMQGDDPNVQSQQILASGCFENPCQNGATCVPDFFGFSCECPPGFSGVFCESRQNFCETSPCQNGGTCRNMRTDYSCDCPDGFEGKKCDVNVDECESQPCQNGGVCVDGPNSFTCNCPSGFQGPICEVNIDDCAGSPCRHGGTCVDDVSAYSCQCPPGYRGENCEIDKDECQSNPCLNNAVCRDAVNSFRCECAAGFTGARCEADIDECQSGPCKNGGSCINGADSYRCHCPTGFMGDNCERVIDENFQLDFPGPGTMNYASLPMSQSLSELSVSFWMKTGDTANYGTPFSYAVPGNDNALVLTDPNGLVLYVNGEKTVTDIPVNDNRWHHVVVTWSSNRGLWKMYVDGLLNDSGFDLSTSRPVPGGGVFVVGQEQDSVGGGFSASESFVGHLTHLNVFDRELSLQQVEALRTSCSQLRGNVIAWPDVASHLHGSLTDSPSTFCQDCPEPESPQYGRREWTALTPGSWVTYSCLRGFNVAGRERFQCLSSGEWEEAAPTCERVSCGYPGSFRNGYVRATRYTFDNRARYTCNRGYRLVGPETRYCNEFGVWEGNAPECIEITCELPLLSENTVISNPRDKYVPGTEVRFDCKPGNRMLTEHNSVLCQSDGTWDKSVPTCDPQTCGVPPVLENGGHDGKGSEFNVGAQVQYDCSYGFVLSQAVANAQGQLTCLPTGQWQSSMPQCDLITCPSIPIVAHADATGDEVTFLSSVIYECHAGYELEGADLIECIETGSWDPRPPSCNPVSCGEPPQLPNGRHVGTTFLFGSYVGYECDAGYTLAGNLRRRCGEDKSWSGEEPVCKPIVCGRPDSIENGQVRALAISFRSVATYECDARFTIEGEATRTCMENGRWEPGPPTCTPAFCSPPPHIGDGYMYRDNPDSPFSIGTEVKYFCNVGYKLTTVTNTITCSAAGQWEGDLPECELFECPRLLSPEHGSVSVTGLTFASVAAYACDEGYELEGVAQRMCNVDETWTEEAPTCKRAQCPVPANLANGRLDFKDLFIGSIVRYICNPGYRRVGVEIRRCQSDLTLSDQSPTCEEVTCPELGPLQHGEVVYAERTINAAAAYLCDEGFQMEGDLRRVCQSSGAWSGAEPRCVRMSCPTPSDVIDHGRLIGDDFSYQAMVRYECNQGYRLLGLASRLCQANGEWDSPEPRCLPVECPPPLLINGYFSSFAREFGATVTLSCRQNYRLEGAAQRTCQANGTWSGVETRCVRIVCGELAAPEHGALTLEKGDRLARFTCDVGFRLEGAAELRCLDDSTWDLAPPTCLRVTCQGLSLDHGSITLSDGSYFGSEAVHSCQEGYRLQGTQTRRCDLLEGQYRWSGEIAVCQLVTCPPPPPLTHGDIRGSNFTYSATVTFSCRQNYRLEGAAERTCQNDGAWSGVETRCVRIVCGELAAPEHGALTLEKGDRLARFTCDVGFRLEGAAELRCLDDSTWDLAPPTCLRVTCQGLSLDHGSITLSDGSYYGSEAVHTCQEGYRLRGAQTRRCDLLEGQYRWSGEIAVCQLVTCPPPPPLTHGDIRGSNFTYSATVTFSCRQNYRLEGAAERTCQANGAWSGVETRCVRIVCGELAAPEHGALTLEKGDRLARFTCDVGFRLEGAAELRCLDDSTWDLAPPTCLRVMCQGLSLDHGSVTLSDGSYYGSEAEHSCQEGYRLQGAQTRRCDLLEGQYRWSGEIAVCQLVTCPPPPPLTHGDIRGSNFTYSATVTFSCRQNYRLDGAAERTCQSDGTWSGVETRCVRIVCGELAAPEHGALTLEKGDRLARFTCDVGFRLEGAAELRCLDDSTWDLAPPTCLKVTCQGLSLDHGSITLSDGSYYGSEAVHTCQEGYRLQGTQTRRCDLLEGQYRWSGEIAVCQLVTCPPPPPLTHGDIRGSNFTYSATVTFSCRQNYRLEGAAERTCQSDGAWSGVETRCVRIVCGELAAPEHGALTLEKGDRLARFTCDVGFRLEGAAELRCLDDSTWDLAPPSCLRVTCQGLSLDHGSITLSDGSYFGSEAVHSCQEGYRLQGAQTRRCDLLEGQYRWSGEIAVCQLVTCPPPPPLTHGDIRGSNFTYSATVTFSCRQNYRLEGAAERTCQANGTWSGVETRCVRIVCGELAAPEHGALTLEKGDRLARFTCDVGFRLEGAAELRCLDDSTWDLAPPTCLRVTCQDLGQMPVEHGQVSLSDGAYYGSEAAYLCDEGYRLQGPQRRRCQLVEDQYRWDGEAPVCLIVSCGPPADYPDGEIQGSTFTFRSVITYACGPGRRLIGQHQRTCQADGQWSGMVPACNLVVCPPLQAPVYGAVAVPSRVYQSTATYSCSRGYELSGRAVRACLEDGTWEHVQPECVLWSCGEPESVQHARLLGDAFTLGRNVQYVCQPGFRLQGSAFRMCLPSKTWSGIPPRCQRISCPDVPPLEHGTVSGSSFLYNDTVSFSCLEGFLLLGDSSQTCLAEGTWSGLPPMCDRVSCDVIPAVPEAVPHLEAGMAFGDVMTFTCNPGYTLKGDPSVTCQADGMWSPVAFTCQIVRCPPITEADVPNAVVTGNVTFGSDVTIQCKEGYRLVGVTSLRCTDVGTWSDVFPTCHVITCPQPLAPDSGNVDYVTVTYGSVLTYRCAEGYDLVGVANQTCTLEGAWSGNLPTCRRVTCPLPSAVENGSIVSRQAEYEFQDTVTYACAERYELVGEDTLLCLATGQWSHQPPTCLKILCPPPGILPNGMVNGTEDELTYRCQEGYNLTGPTRRQCLATGQWENDPPVCTPVPCPPPAPLTHGSMEGDVFAFMETVSFICDPGFILVGSDVRTCLANGTWDGVEPRCERIACQSLGQVANGQIIGEALLFEDVVQYSCNYGYLLSGDSERVCQANGTWSGSEPTCSQIVCPAPPQTPHGTYNTSAGNVYGVGSHVIYTCEEGFRPDGLVTLECVLQGREPVWSHLEPLCLQIVCPAVVPPENGRVLGSGVRYGETVTFECQPGYLLSGQTSARCQQDGAWSNPVPTCTPKLCPHPSAPNNGSFQLVELFPGQKSGRDVTGYRVGDEVLFTCDVGFDLDGSPESRCLQTGEWSAPTPFCVPIVCGPVPEVPFAVPVVDAVTYGSTAYYVCQDSYELVGNNMIHCDHTGAWLGSLPTCRELVCAPPPIIPFATVTVRGRRLKTARYVCNDGYQIRGSPFASCEGKGWTYDVDVRCERVDCGPPPSLDHGSVPGSGTDFNTTRNYACHPGYELSPSLARVRCTADSTWQHEGGVPARCTPVSCGPPITDAIVIGDDFTYGSSVSFSCLPGHELIGPSTVTCGINRSWNNFLPSCARKSCGTMQLSAHVRVARGNPETASRYGDSLTLHCDPGFTLIGQANVTCHEDGQWSATSPVCRPVSCGPPLTDAIVNGDDFTYGSSVFFTCSPGHDLIGPAKVTCGVEGSWSDILPSCSRQTCGTLTLPEHARAVLGDAASVMRYGDTLELICEEGFALVGQFNITCEANGRWNADLPVCEPVIDIQQLCLSNVELAHAQPIPSGFLAGDWTQVKCESGFRPAGDMTSLCQDDLSWTVPSGHCRRVSCGKPPMTDMVNIWMFGRSFLYGDAVRYRCRPGLTPLKRPPIIKCQASGQWDGEVACSSRCKITCLNGGMCVGFNKCKCRAGYTGVRCHLPVCVLPCLHGGTCKAPYTCDCLPGYEGSRCQRPVCAVPCEHGGICMLPNRCRCFNGYKPPFCQAREVRDIVLSS